MALSLKDLAPAAIAFVFIAIVLSIGGEVLGGVQEDQITATTNCGLNSTGGTGGTLIYSGCGYDYNATQQGLNSVGELSSWLPLIALVIAAAVVIGVLSFFNR